MKPLILVILMLGFSFDSMASYNFCFPVTLVHLKCKPEVSDPTNLEYLDILEFVNMHHDGAVSCVVFDRTTYLTAEGKITDETYLDSGITETRYFDVSAGIDSHARGKLIDVKNVDDHFTTDMTIFGESWFNHTFSQSWEEITGLSRFYKSIENIQVKLQILNVKSSQNPVVKIDVTNKDSRTFSCHPVVEN